MEIGILGLPQSGKSTLFKIMTGIHSRDADEYLCVRGLSNVPDSRFDDLVDVFDPDRKSPAKVPFIDINSRSEHTWESVRQTLNGADCFIHVVDAFSSQSAHDMINRYRKIEDEIILADLQVVENRIERMRKVPAKALKTSDISQREIFPALRRHLEEGNPLRTMGLSPYTLFSLKSYSFWTLRPELVVINLGEESPSVMDMFLKETDYLVPAVEIHCQLEAELIMLAQNEQKEFLDALGLDEPAFVRIIKKAFSMLDRICYFTVGDDEVKAWVVPAGAKAPKAAAAIHKDFERGFIRAEVVSYDDFVIHGKKMANVKAAGKLRLEGKDYEVQDGDIISFRFNV